MIGSVSWEARPNQVIFAVSTRIGPPPVYEELRREGVIDQILLLEGEGRSVLEIDAEAINALS